ncbi:S-adenosyl-L-methionine-dependent methyltransferase [Jackrogersella minutella]|nr:S-adenosyl-L-methionine-dependent methyltransferase [Jackrogersella minutella]
MDSKKRRLKNDPEERAKLEMKKQVQRDKKNKKKARKRERDMTTGSTEEILEVDVENLIESLKLDKTGTKPFYKDQRNLPAEGSEIDVKVVELSSTGEGLALQEGSKRIYVVPFAVPGDTVKVKIYRHLRDEFYSVADFISVVTPSPSRDDSNVKCKYFATCAGCQFQMMDYADQLQHKKRIVEKAFRNFSELPPELVPAVQDTIGSPLQYGYRTKLTPHFDAPEGARRKSKIPHKECPPIGFMAKGKRTPLDIEDCPIGTDAVRVGMKRERARMAAEYGNYTRGATLLLRENTERISKDATQGEPEVSTSSSPKEATTTEPPSGDDVVRVETESHTDLKTCVTDNKGQSTEYVGPFVFRNPAGSFFQNNNSILPVFTDYIRQRALPPSSSPDVPSAQTKYLIDAYSGSGLFTIMLSSLFSGGSVGIDISEASIKYAGANAAANGISEDRARFIAADAGALFTPEVRATYPADETVVVIDPPRKGCDASFLRQLLEFAPRRVLYVSCNVHTQARDVGMLVRGEVEWPMAGSGSGKKTQDSGNEETEATVKGEETETTVKGEETETTAKGEGRKARYAIESLCGFDFFPQTSHVEGVAVLNRVDD